MIHGYVSTHSVVIDGETHRGKLMAREALERIRQIGRARVDSQYQEGTERYEHFARCDMFML